MRMPRVILCDDDVVILDLLETYFSKRGYEVLRFTNPAICPIYEKHTDNCKKGYQCADILLNDYKMPRMSGIELLQRQFRTGCKLDIRNKAIISGVLNDANKRTIDTLGCGLFIKPFTLSEISGWVDECEKRFDLSKPLETVYIPLPESI